MDNTVCHSWLEMISHMQQRTPAPQPLSNPRKCSQQRETLGNLEQLTLACTETASLDPAAPPAQGTPPSLMHLLDRKCTGTAVPFLTKSLSPNSASKNVRGGLSGGLRKSKIKLIIYNFSPKAPPVSNYFQLRGFPESNVVSLLILLLPPSVFLFQVLIHSGEINFK